MLLRHLKEERPQRARAVVFSVLGRVYLQLGDVVKAQRAFNCAADLRDSSVTRDVVATLVDAALVAIAQNAFTEAYGYYQQAMSRDPDNALVSSFSL